MNKKAYVSFTFFCITNFSLIPSIKSYAQKPQHAGAQTDSVQSKTYSLGGITVSGERKLVSVNAISSQIDKTTIDRSLGQSLATMLERISGLWCMECMETVCL